MPLTPTPPGSRQYQILAQPASTVIAGLALGMGWFMPLSDPAKPEPGLSAAWMQYTTGFTVPAATPTTVTTDWLSPLSEPVRAKSDIRFRREFTVDAKWDAPSAQVTFIYGALSEPVRVESGLSAAWTQYHTGFLVPPPVTDIKAFQPLSEPVRVKGRAPQFRDLAWHPTTDRGLTLAQLSPRFSDPVRVKPQPFRGQTFTTDWNKPAVTLEYWYSGLSEPVRIEPGLGAAWTQYHTGFLVPAVTATAYNWFSPLSEPPPIEIGLGAAYQQVSSVGTAVAFVQYVFPPFSEPVRVKQGLHASRQQFLAYNPTTPTFTDLRNHWYRPWSEPVRSKKAVAWQQPFTTDWQWNVTVRLEWFEGLSEPVRSKKPVAWQQFFTTDPTTPAAVTDLRNYWYQPFSEPVRSKKPVPWQQFFTFDLRPTDLRTYWYWPLSEPVRTKKSVPWQQPFAMDWKWSPPATQTFAGWYKWFSEPQRQKPGLHAARQQFFTMDWRWSPPTSLLVPGWHRWLSEPVRQKQGLHASRQQFFTMDWKWTAPPIIAISYTLSSTEQGDYGRLFYTSMDIVIGAYVTVTEEEVGNMAVVTITERSE